MKKLVATILYQWIHRGVPTACSNLMGIEDYIYIPLEAGTCIQFYYSYISERILLCHDDLQR